MPNKKSLKHQIIIILLVIFLIIFFKNRKLEDRIKCTNLNIISQNPFIIYHLLFKMNNDKKKIKNIIIKSNISKEFINLMTPDKIDRYFNNLIFLQYTKIYNIKIITMMGDLLCNDLVKHVKYCSNIEGDFVDVGVWHGGSSMLMKEYNIRNKKVFLLDLFDHMSNNSLTNEDTEKDKATIKILNIVSSYFNSPTVATTINTVKENFKKYNVPLNNCHFLKGNLNDINFPYYKINKISLLRIDCDFYSATKSVLDNLYHKVSPGGIIIFDDYNLEMLGEKDAAQEFLKNKNYKIYNVGQSAYIVKI